MRLIPIESKEAEQAVLGCMLVEKMAVIECMQQLEDTDFYYPEHTEIFNAISEMCLANKAVDFLTVHNKLADKVDIEYLIRLTEMVTTTENVKHYIGIVKGKAVRRQYVRAGMSIIEKAQDGEYANINEFKADALKEVDIDVNEKSQDTIRDIVDRVKQDVQERKDGKHKGAKYGFEWVDKHTGGAWKTDLTILAARPSVGKTALAIQIATNMAKQGKNVAVFSLEMSKEQLVQRMICNQEFIQNNKLKYPSYMDQEDNKRFETGSKFISSLPIEIFDDIYKLESIQVKCRELKIKQGLDYVVIDYLQLCDTLNKFKSGNERVTFISRQAKLMAKDLKVPVLMLSQLSRANESENRRPKLTDLRESGSIEQDADNVFFLYDASNGQYGEADEVSDVEFIVAKQRNGMRDIFTHLKFYKNTQRWCD